MVVLSGVGSIRELDKGALQDVNQVDMIKPVTKWTGKCHDVTRIPEYLQAAFTARGVRPAGPRLPGAAPGHPLSAARRRPRSPSRPRRSAAAAVSPDEGLIAEAAELLNNAEKPLLVAGDGICWSDADAELLDLVEKAGIPTLLMNCGRGAIPDEHPLSLWPGGFAGLIAALSMADVVLAVGIRFNWLLNYGDYMANARVIRVDIDPVEVNRNRTADVALVGDAGAVLRQLEPPGGGTKDRGEWIEPRRHPDHRERGRPAADGDARRPYPPLPAHASAAGRWSGDDAIYIIDGGDTVYFGLVTLRARR